MSNELTDYKLPETAYTTFDADSLKSLIIQRLNQQGNFTDQIYEGSNLSSFIDVIAYSYHVLIYYLNQTASESVFSESTIYENVNRIVKLLNYNPLGYQSSTLAFNAFATEDLAPGTYTIPRYTYINNNSVAFSTNQDITFTKYTTGEEEIQAISEGYLLYQGEWQQSTVIEAIGSNFETLALKSSESDKFVDHFNVHVYVKHANDDVYREYKETTSLYIHKNNELVFEKRLNEDLSYELKFGNNITGRRLDPGDKIVIYYLESLGEKGKVGPGFLDDSRLVIQGTSLFNQILTDVKPQNINYVTLDNLDMMSLTNTSNSTDPQQRESVEEIKRKAPIHFNSQNRLVTLNDYDSYISKNFEKLLSSAKVIENIKFMDGHVKYLTEGIGLSEAFTESRIMFNHLDYASGSTVNNVYIYAVPRVAVSTSLMPMTTFLTASQKSLILDDIKKICTLTTQPIMMDPVYVAVNFATRTASELATSDLVDLTKIEIKRKDNVTKDDSAIIDQVANVIIEYFSNINMELGQLINVGTLSQRILDIDGVQEISTVRTDTGQRMTGLSLCVWNPVYPDEDIEITNQNIKLPYFKFPYMYDTHGLTKKIEIID